MTKKRTDWIWGTPLGTEYQELIGKDNASLIEQNIVRRIDLTEDENSLLKHMTKGHRSNIKQAIKKGVVCNIYDSKNIEQDVWLNFLKMHKTTESRINRNPRCWDIMFEFIKRGEGFLIGASYREKWVAFSLFLIFEKKGYYAMANIKEEFRALSPSHLIQWEAMKYMKAHNIELYDLGTDFIGEAPEGKEREIIRFKRGFGGIAVSLFPEKNTGKVNFFAMRKPAGSYNQNAKKIILSASEPLAFRALLPLLEKLEDDLRCSMIVLTADNVAGNYFKKYFESFGSTGFVYLNEMPEGNFDVAVVTIDAYTKANSLFYSAKNKFGVKKCFILHYGWTALSGRKDFFKNDDIVDGIFCNDDLAKDIILEHVPGIAPYKIHVTGTPVIDNLKKSNRIVGRNMLSIAENEFMLLYLGDTYEDYESDENVDTLINKKTFLHTLFSLKQLSAELPEKKIVLAFRPHPRNASKEDFLLQEKNLLDNFRVITASENDVSIEEAIYACDAVASIVSTENHLAPLRGKFGIFLAYEAPQGKKKLGAHILESIYGKKIIETLRNKEGISIVFFPEELKELIKKIISGNLKFQTPELKKGDSIERITEIIFKQ